ncbi:MAG: class D sortase, partial [Thermoanaerobaculia bacterium]
MSFDSRMAVPSRSTRRNRVPGLAPSRRFAGALVVSGVVLVGVAAFHRLDGAFAQERARQATETSIAGQAIPAGADTRLRITIPRLGVDLAVFEGVSEQALRRGPGHLPGTPCPGLSSSSGNCVLTGHRDSFFRPLSRARAGDLVVLRSNGKSKRYRLVKRLVVSPEETYVAGPTSDARLTLLTCYPFRWIGPAPLRLAWQAEPEGPRPRMAPP